MIILTSGTDTLKVVLSGAVTANHLPCYTTWRDVTSATYTPGRTAVNTSNTTPVVIVGAPDTATQRVVDQVSIHNQDTMSAVVTVTFYDNATPYVIQKAALAPGEKLEFAEGSGWKVLSSTGAVKNLTQAAPYVTSNLNIVVMAADVVNAEAVANTMKDLPGLTFPVTAGETYWFEFVIPYTAAATTTGSRWSINGPGISMLNYTSEYTLTATTKTLNCATAYDIPAASNASSLTTGNIATIWGIIKPAAGGSIVGRFASEVTVSAITAKAGGVLRWMKVL